MPVQIKPIGAVDKDTTPLQLSQIFGGLFSDLADQLNRETKLYYSRAGKVPDGMQEGDLLIQRSGGTVSLFVKSSSQKFDPLTLPQIVDLQAQIDVLDSTVGALPATIALKLDASSTNFKGLITNTSAGLVNFPTANDWGFQNNAGVLSLHFNNAGTVKKVNLT